MCSPALDLRSRLSVREGNRHVTDSFLKRQKQLDRLVIVEKAINRRVSFEALPLWPAIFGAAGRVDVQAPHLLRGFYITWDGSGESPNNWTLKSSDGKFKEMLNEKSFDELLGRLLPAI